MKTAGIALLFGLCTLFGFRAAAKKTERLKTVRALLSGLQSFSAEIDRGNSTLQRIAACSDGVFFTMLAAYLRALDDGKSEPEAVEQACENLRKESGERAALLLFLTGLSDASRTAVAERIRALKPALQSAQDTAEAEAKKGRAFRCIGALIGAGLAILLI